MQFRNVDYDNSLSPFVKSIAIYESKEKHSKTDLPFFADGFPGLVYHESPNGLYVYPHNKPMPRLFIYGQTITPINIRVTGCFQMIVFQLYPFTLKSLFTLDPKSIQDSCCDLSMGDIDFLEAKHLEIGAGKKASIKINMLTEYIVDLIEAKKENIDHAVYKATQKILSEKGKLNIDEIARTVYLSKRTFERRFLSETGLSPKQFSKIIQFQNSLIQLSSRDFDYLTDIVYENGYADQSHFIRVFKSFTGKTPKSFVRLSLEN